MTVFHMTHFHQQNTSQLNVEITDELKYAEDVVIYLSKLFFINPIARHLFGLYHMNNKIWMANNQVMTLWKETNVLEFRLRFRPNINTLKFNLGQSVDYNTFNYYFNQIRHDFISGKFEYINDNIGKIYGLAVTDMVREALNTDIINADKIIDDFANFLPQNCKKPKLFLSTPKDKIKASFYRALNSSQQQTDQIVYIQKLFIEDFITSLCPNYGIETYNVMFDNRYNTSRHHLIEVKVQYIHFYDNEQQNGIFCKPVNDTKDEWTKCCSISDIGFISLDNKTKTVEISRTSGVPYSFTFKHDLDMKSFVSLLDGYYRLSVKWSFNICKDVSSPSLARLRKNKTHGPVDYEFALNKLKEKSNDMTGAYILRESLTKYDEYKMDVFIRHELFETFKLKVTGSQIVIEVPNKRHFESFADFIKSFSFMYYDGNEISLTQCITPSEHDLPLNLLLCRHNNKESTSQQEADRLGPPVIASHLLKLSNTTLTNNSRYGVRLANFMNKQFIVKEVKSVELTQEFLKTVSQWSHLRNDSVVTCKGITLCSPLAILLEYIPIGPLDAFLMANKQNLKLVDLVESISYLSRALWYLFENNVVHGHIRCHNLLVHEYSSNCLKVKLSDPISDNDINMERVWLPPEYLTNNEWTYSFRHLTHSVDVWAFGTTVWQIFSYGVKPNCEDVFELSKPNDCPNEIWTLVGECWTMDCESRKQPHSIYRDISQILYEVFNCQRNDYYSKPVFEEPKPSKSNLFKNWSKYKSNSIFGSNFSLSSSSIVSQQSFSTYLTNSIKANETTIGSDNCLLYDHNGFDGANGQPNEPWLIEAHQLKVGKVIGTGCYGEVLKATLTHCAGLKEEVVAVKRIKSVASDSQLRDMKREIEIMKKLSHKNIVEIKGFVEDLSDQQTMLVMEFVELGSLVAYLRHNRYNKSIIPLVKFAMDITLGMEYLESKSIVHRDLAARNILVADEDYVKISDFGLAQFIDSNNQYYQFKTSRELPLRWYAPESLKYCKFSHKSDVWSFGIVLWEMYSFGDNPQLRSHNDDMIGDSELTQALEKGLRLCLPADCPLQVYQIMMSCWQKDSHLRPSFTQLKNLIKEIPQ
ncbi:tyrosine-protein kinase JAK2-like [Oppia nitens]|uniref:tyrosine-protein kinase JAK2-like n=1 Tax=Oppia nitens TaxID=1686743 RepID=UPI0023DB7CD7|nr:tyrosine-protein kinase JAK2-like [Oppia nitens]